jgi:hypothetical protein
MVLAQRASARYHRGACHGTFLASLRRPIVLSGLSFREERRRGRLRAFLIVASVLTAACVATVFSSIRNCDEGRKEREFTRRAARHERAIDAIEQLGGGVKEAKEDPVGVYLSYLRSGPPVRNLRSPSTHVPIAVDLEGTQVRDHDLANLEEVAALTQLNLSHTDITDEGLAHLEAITDLEGLSLNDVKLTDVGLMHVGKLHRLKSLDLRGTKITDAGLVHLSGLTQLTLLDLSGTRITDAGLVHLVRLRSLRRLAIENTGVTERGRNELRQSLPNWYDGP